jgi:hypothetical protein
MNHNRSLHPTLKACKCGKVFTRSQLYRHFGALLAYYKQHGNQAAYPTMHGEVPLFVGDPRVPTRKETTT